jgi:outer membrane receptor protein involved in Fe transport
MKTNNKLLLAAMLGTSGLLGTQIYQTQVAIAQSATTGAIQGAVTDSKTGEKLVGVTVTVTSTSLQGAQTAITDENGFYKISPLPPGDYLVTFYYLDLTVERTGVGVGVNRTTPVFQKLDQGKAGGEVVKITDTAPTIDPTSTTQGITIDKNYLKNIPVPGRTFESALGAAAGSQGDGVGISFSGSSSLENQYYVDGVNTTGLTFGTVGSPVINDFIEEIEVITGGYNAEFGRATGGVINVVTKSGSNEFKGSVFGYFQPGIFTFSSERTPTNAASIDAQANVVYDADFGFEMGGPIIKDKLWFYVGFAPAFSKVDITRTVKSQTDCRALQTNGTLSACDTRLAAQGGFADGAADVDPETGFFITKDIDEEIRSNTSTNYNMLGKINYALNSQNQGQIALQALPGSSKQPGIFGPQASGFKTSQLTTDLSAKWTSKFNDNKTEVEAVIGWHRDYFDVKSFNGTLANDPRQVLFDGSLGLWAPSGAGTGIPESQKVIDGCRNMDQPGGGNDEFPFIDNCPMDASAYVVGGPGSLTRDTEQRRSARLGVTQRLKAAGSHEFKAGVDVEDNYSDKSRAFSGGAFLQNSVGNVVLVDRFVQLQGASNMDDPRFDNSCKSIVPEPDPDPTDMFPSGATKPVACDFIGGTLDSPGARIKGNTMNWAAYLRDSWQIQPNLTLNVGLRYEEQRLRYANFLQNQNDPLTGNPLGKNAMTLTGNFSPRVGVLYDWTKEGRSKVYAHWGRFYESIPMQINDRAFGGEITYRQRFATGGPVCGDADPSLGGPNGVGCLDPAVTDMATTNQLIGASGVLIAPGIKSQYMDEIIGGFEYEILEDLKVGVSYQNRVLGRVVEDVSTDGANTYIIANPGEWAQEEQTKIENRIAVVDGVCQSEGPTSQSCVERDRLTRDLGMYKGIRQFDKPRRDYNALQFTLTRRFSKALYIQGSYTYSKTAGNYGGLISYDNGQIDPNISSQYDLIELLANRIGPLQTDRPHYIKLDGYYTFDFKKSGSLTVGARLRALSGTPTNALGGHFLYGGDESFLLPRGQLGRTDFEHGLDMHFGYGKQLNKNYKIEVFLDAFNIYNRQGQANLESTYAPFFRLSGPGGGGGTQQNANPISGGTYEDLIFLKTIDETGKEPANPTPIGTNPNFRNTTSRYAPGNARIGVRLTF